ATNPNNYWAVSSGKWWSYAGDLKLLAFVALVSCVTGLARGHWQSPLRLLVLLILLAIGFTFCLAKHLYAREQQAFEVLHTIETELRDKAVDAPSDVLRRRAAKLGDRKFLLALSDNRERPWWNLRWLDTDFFRRGA